MFKPDPKLIEKVPENYKAFIQDVVDAGNVKELDIKIDEDLLAIYGLDSFDDKNLLYNAYLVYDTFAQLTHNLIYWDTKYKEQFGKDKRITRDYYRKRCIPDYKTPIEDYYGSFKNFCNLVIETENNPNRESFDIIVDDRKNKKSRKYFITAAIAGDTLCRSFFNAIQTFCKKENAKLVILPMRGVKTLDEEYADDLLELSDYFVTDYWFNDNIRALDLRLHPRQFLPLSQINRLGKETSFIVAHPKVQMETTEVGIGKFPHILHSTGCITEGKTYGNIRSGKISEIDHSISGIVLEVVNSKEFHIRHCQFNLDSNSFIDFGTEYFDNGKVKKTYPEAIYMGDGHNGYACPKTLKATYDIINELKIKKGFVGDQLDGSSISHHHIHNMQAQVNLPEHLSTLKKEMDLYVQSLLTFSERCKNFHLYMVQGNHEDHLSRYLNERRYENDRTNYRIALELAIDHIDLKNPIEQYTFRQEPKLKEKITFLERDSSHKIGGIEHALHGDKTTSGKRGGLQSLEKGYGKSILGHRHAPGIFRNLYVVGTMTHLKLPYTDGYATNWLNTHCLTYSNGNRQLINIINGKYKL